MFDEEIIICSNVLMMCKVYVCTKYVWIMIAARNTLCAALFTIAHLPSRDTCHAHFSISLAVSVVFGSVV